MQFLDQTSASINNGPSKSQVITSVQRCDVLMGRGATIDNNPGNVVFRRLVRSQKETYMSTARHQRKQEIAQKIKEAITLSGGRFLRKIESVAELTEMGAPQGVAAWTYADDRTIFLKIKQALRDKGKNAKEITCSKSVLFDSMRQEDSGQQVSLYQGATTSCDYGTSTHSATPSLALSNINQRLASQVTNLDLSSLISLQEPRLATSSEVLKAKLLAELSGQSIINNQTGSVTNVGNIQCFSFGLSALDAMHFSQSPIELESIKRNCFSPTNGTIYRSYVSDTILARIALEALRLQCPMK